MNCQILPSLLAADLGHLADECRRAQAAGADALHLDIMDAHFVPNLSFSIDTVAMARKVCPNFTLNVHLMMTNPEKYFDRFISAGADALQIHVETGCNIPEVLHAIRARGVVPGVVLNPATPAKACFDFLPHCGQILCMTVNPGYGGQSFMPEVLPKIVAIRAEAERLERSNLDILVDGGITRETAALCARAGASMFVAGSSLYKLADMKGGIDEMRRSAMAAHG